MVIVIKSILSVLLSVISIFTSGFLGGIKTTFEPLDKENIKLNFAVISDVHMEDNYWRKNMLGLGLYDLEHSKSKLDALVISGDNTNNGQREEYDALESVFSKYTPARNIILAQGNHDTKTEKGNYPESERVFIEYNKRIADRDIEKAYYTTEINGYTFIVLASEIDRTYAYISEEQLEWLSNEMEKASKKDLPIFVVTHWPFNQTHGLPDVWGRNVNINTGGFGDQSDKIEHILKKYENVFMISGHVHNGFTNEFDSKIYGYSSVENDGSFHSISVPCYMYFTYKGRVCNGTGYQFEVYNNQVIIRARCYSSGVWYTAYDYTFDLV